MQTQKALTITVLPIIFLILMCSLAPRFVFADPIDLGEYNKLEIQGAHVVSEGAYFRFFMVNHYGIPIYVTVNDGDPIHIPINGSVDYDVIAPQVSAPFEVVTYIFKQFVASQQNPFLEVDFPVTVVASNFISSIIVTNITIAIGLFTFVVTFIIWYRRISSGKIKLNKTEPTKKQQS